MFWSCDFAWLFLIAPDLFSKKILKLQLEGVLQGDGLFGAVQAAGRFFYQEFDLIEGDAALLVQVEGVQHAVKGLVAPRVLAAFLGCHLEGTLEIFAQENAGGPAVVIGVGQDGGMHDDPAEGVVVRLFLAVEPGIGRLVVRVHMGDDVGGVFEDVPGVQFVHPGPVDAASRLAVGPVAALNFAALFEFGVHPVARVHGCILTVM